MLPVAKKGFLDYECVQNVVKVLQAEQESGKLVFKRDYSKLFSAFWYIYSNYKENTREPNYALIALHLLKIDSVSCYIHDYEEQILITLENKKTGYSFIDITPFNIILNIHGQETELDDDFDLTLIWLPTRAQVYEALVEIVLEALHEINLIDIILNYCLFEN